MITMVKLKMMTAGVILAGSVGLVGAPAGHADPFTVAERKFLADVRPNLTPDSPSASWSDDRLVGEGWFACHDHAIGLNLDQAGISPVIGTYALLDLCPNGCPQGCLHRQ
jgi:hypothetical protein